MTRWFRAYDDALNDPKVQRLPGELFKAWFNLLCVASKHDGTLPEIETIAFMIRSDIEKIKIDLDQLKAAGLIDEDETGLRPHNWHGRQYKSDVSNERVKRHRERHRNGHDAVTVTPPEQRDTETERTDARAIEFSRFRKELTGLYAKHFPDRLCPDTGLCDVWEGQGFDRALSIATIGENFERTKKFKPPNYFTPVLADAHAVKDAPKKNSITPVSRETLELAWTRALDEERKCGAWASRIAKASIPESFIAQWEAQRASN